MRHIVHTVPKRTHLEFDDYVRDIETSSHNYYHSGSKRPKVAKGSRRYVSHSGKLRAYIPITGQPFYDAAGLQSPHKSYKSGPGYYTPGANKVVKLKKPVAYKGHQGYRYKK